MAKKKGRFSFINEIHESIIKTASVSRTGTVKLKRADVKAAIENASPGVGAAGDIRDTPLREIAGLHVG